MARDGGRAAPCWSSRRSSFGTPQTPAAGRRMWVWRQAGMAHLPPKRMSPMPVERWPNAVIACNVATRSKATLQSAFHMDFCSWEAMLPLPLCCTAIWDTYDLHGKLRSRIHGAGCKHSAIAIGARRILRPALMKRRSIDTKYYRHCFTASSPETYWKVSGLDEGKVFGAFSLGRGVVEEDRLEDREPSRPERGTQASKSPIHH